ncbi:hypothetical protein LTR85_008441 [Meristemomyces frigidus]|nr:hypothetical protein LTR85_008441 [Meristemomyces frigidus]
MEDSNGRAGSEAPSSTTSDFYGTDPPREQALDAPVVSEQPVTNGRLTADGADSAEHDDGGDSSSEMDVSASSRSASPEPDQESVHHTAGSKRKLSDAEDNLDALEQALEDSTTKKRKLSTPPQHEAPSERSPAEALPAELWQHIFLRLSPAMLSRCLRVSKAFNTYLTKTKAQPVAKKDQKKVRLLDSDTVWAEARKLYFPNMPRPLMRCNELGMLQLIGCKTCQFCNRPPRPVPATSPFNAGPGPDGLRVVWPFGIRTCGQCWEHHTLKDVQILVSPAASLRFGIPYAFRTPELHFVPEMTRQLPGGIPSHLRVAKVYYNKDVQAIQEEYDDVKGYGEGTAEEWRKGLSTKGKEAMVDAARWEKWESQMRLGTDLAHVLRECDLPSFPRLLEAQGRSAGVNGSQPPAVMNGQHTLPQPVHAFQNGFGNPFHAPNPQFQQAHRTVRSAHEVEEARAARKADIERRCMELQPPLEPSVLQHVESFQAAMQITTPMNDGQWEMLRPRILAQREAAELLGHQRAEQLAALQAAMPSVIPDDSFLKPAKEVYDREYEQAQDPLRKRLGEYADELINGQWHGGQGLDRDAAPSFAIQVLLHVRKRYLEDKRAGLLPEYDQTAKSGSSKQGTPSPDPFLSLDNMKWVYDNKVRTYTDQYRRELFICAGCAEERKPKWFAFEGLIQHYGAKHTTAFSRGNIVVHWQTAGWPDEPPFHTNPSPWIKMDRKVSDYKASRARNTPQQTGHNAPFMPPSPGVLLSENPLFSSAASPQQVAASNGYYQGSHGHPAYAHQPGPYGAQRSVSMQATASAPAIDTSYDVQLNKLSSDAHDVWDHLDGVKELLECVRVQTVIHHIVTRFTEQFHHKPNLDLLTDSLATNTLMRSIKNANGLACKLCVASQTDGSASYQSYYARIRNVKLYNASSLITHFKIVHQPQEEIGYLDWSKDMIELPETQLISELINAPGMDDEKLALVADAFPKAFPSPLPKIGLVTEAPPDVGPDSGLANRLLDRLNKKQKQGPKKKGQHTNGTPGREGSQEVLEVAEDEYDPTRPIYTPSKEHAADPARFDTDLARKASASVPQTAGPAFNLAPETLAALNSLTALTAQNGHAPVKLERSPSVGRPEPPIAKQPHAAGNGAPAAAPDISAILASLTGQLQPAHTATPPSTISNPGSLSQLPFDPYRASHPSPAYRPESRRSSGRYAHEATYRASAEPPSQYAAQDLQAVLARNSRQYEQNQQVQHSYVELPPQYAPQHAQAPSSRSPPRYRYVYEDEQPYASPQQYAPMHREQPVQYIQLPDQYQAPQQHLQYQYEHRPAPPKPIYVDEYGRPVELIPIDAAPAPVQYAPHPYEQQLQQQQYARQLAYSAAPPPGAQHYQQPMYYEQAAPAPGGQQARYVYDDGARSSVPRT